MLTREEFERIAELPTTHEAESRCDWWTRARMLVDHIREREGWNMPEQLKPCPFCGGQAMLGRSVNHRWVQCREISKHRSGDYLSEGSAVAAWNERVAP